MISGTCLGFSFMKRMNIFFLKFEDGFPPQPAFLKKGTRTGKSTMGKKGRGTSFWCSDGIMGDKRMIFGSTWWWWWW
jgi:hypothetical protein